MDLIVSADGWASWNGKRYRCALGPNGVRREKLEGDGATPAGRFPFRQLLYRADRLRAPATGLSIKTIDSADGWCDDPAAPFYNRAVKLPCAASHERLWRDDGVYDLILVIGHNDDPVRPGQGSAVFIHVAHPDYRPTAGCVALARDDLLEVLASAKPGDCVAIEV
ncbi:MAG TPA: L,D-transpeptidase family protein [Dongiaceae bacterium]|jgi:L,D-peptidoglycan transpeptidase YkuD (ErfK/YbiS/YcfS/YnhG family)